MQIKTIEEVMQEANLFRLFALMVIYGSPFAYDSDSDQSLEATTGILSRKFKSFQCLSGVGSAHELVVRITDAEFDTFSGLTKVLIAPAIRELRLAGALLEISRQLTRVAKMLRAGESNERINEICFYRAINFLITNGFPLIKAVSLAASRLFSSDEAKVLVGALGEGEMLGTAMRKLPHRFKNQQDIAAIGIAQQTRNFLETCVLIADLKECLSLATYRGERALECQINIPTDQIEFFNQLAILVIAGSPMVVALETLAKEHGYAGADITAAVQAIKDGATFAEAAKSKMSGVFPETFIAMMFGAELSGEVFELFVDYANYLGWLYAGIEKPIASKEFILAQDLLETA